MRYKAYKHYNRVLQGLLSTDSWFCSYINRNTTKSTCNKEAASEEKKVLDGSKNLNFFIVMDEKRLVGYFATDTLMNINFLITIFVNPQYRNRVYLSEFWSIIKKTIKDPFFATLPSTHNKGISSYQKSGGVVVAEGLYNKEPHVLLRFGS